MSEPAAVETDGSTAGVSASPDRVNRFWDLILRKPESTIAVAGIALVIYFSVTNDAFLTTANLRIISQYVIPVAILAVGQTMLLICGEIDLSMGAVYFMTPFLLYFAMEAGLPLPIGVVLALAGAGVVGVVNGAITITFGIPSFIVTLGHAPDRQRVHAQHLRRLPEAGAHRRRGGRHLRRRASTPGSCGRC